KVHTLSAERRLTVLVKDTLDQFRLHPGAQGYKFQITGVSLLLPVNGAQSVDRFGPEGAPETGAPAVVDNDQPGFVQTGAGRGSGHTDPAVSFYGNRRVALKGTGQNKVSWEFAGLKEGGRYTVLTTWSRPPYWLAEQTQAGNATYRIHDGDKLLASKS